NIFCDVDTDCCNLHLVFSHFDCLQFNHGTPMPSVGGDHYIRLINRLDNYIASKSLLSADSFSLYSSYTTIIQSGELYLVKKM
ncbi:hypothetical protein, partial [Pseudoalteromonas sp. OANN1]|uniref:hypothetical protein n=1 Tax=Pseudoalteromonas sp. OANN1 TaxID=2954497 RepID=UPI00209802C2